MSENLDPTEAERELRGLAASSALELASTSYLSTEIDVSGDVADYSLDYALDVLGYLEALQSATRTVRRQLEEFIATKLEGVQYYRHRDQIIRVGRGGTWKVTNPEGLASWLEFHKAWHLVNLAAPGAITKTRLEGYYSMPEEPDEYARINDIDLANVIVSLKGIPSFLGYPPHFAHNFGQFGR